jgi:broad specificity phosphatase PhoE
MRLLLVRHGQSEGNANGVIQGHLDFGLSELGERQARATAERLTELHIDRVLTSPLKRAAETARIIAGERGVLVQPEPALMEYDIGEASGLTGPQIRERFPEVSAAYARGERPVFPGEEGRELFHTRLGGVLESLRSTDDTVVAVAHGGVVSAYCYMALGLDLQRRGMFQVWNCSITEIATDRAGRLVIVRHNDTCHLEGIETAVDRG